MPNKDFKVDCVFCKEIITFTLKNLDREPTESDAQAVLDRGYGGNRGDQSRMWVIGQDNPFVVCSKNSPFQHEFINLRLATTA